MHLLRGICSLLCNLWTVDSHCWYPFKIVMWQKSEKYQGLTNKCQQNVSNIWSSDFHPCRFLCTAPKPESWVRAWLYSESLVHWVRPLIMISPLTSGVCVLPPNPNRGSAPGSFLSLQLNGSDLCCLHHPVYTPVSKEMKKWEHTGFWSSPQTRIVGLRLAIFWVCSLMGQISDVCAILYPRLRQKRWNKYA